MIHRILKNIFFIISFLLYLTTLSLSEIKSKEWNTECSDDKNVCIIAIKSEVKSKDNQMQTLTLASAYIQIGSSKKKKMDLINEDDQTYKLREENTNVPMLFVNLPLNTDLKKKPIVVIDGKNLGNLTYSHCNTQEGCKTNVRIDDDAIELFKKGNTMTVFMGIYGSSKGMKIEFPLKNFSKSYKKLIKE